MSDTFFTVSPHWGTWVVLYFFVGGIAGGSLFLAGLLHRFGAPEDRATIRAGYGIAVLGAVLSGVLLIVDLDRPLRFWHMLIQSNTGRPLFKGWSPMSVGAWGLLLFGGVALLGTLGALGETRERWRRTRWLGQGVAGGIIAVLGILLGLFLAGYTGVLLAVTNRPIWADSVWLGPVFLFSGISAALAALYLIGRRRAPSARLHRLQWLDQPMLGLELVTLTVFLVSLGPVAKVWVGLSGALLVAGVVGAGILAPLWMHRQRSKRETILPAVLVLAGSFLLRLLVLTTSSGIHTISSGVAGQ